jgi:hypothetical protein
MSQEDDSNEREDRTVELSGIELRALRESAELTALTRSSVLKKKKEEESSDANPQGLEEGTVPKDIEEADDAHSKDPDTKELPVLVDDPPDPADISDPTRSIDRSSLKEMIKTEVKRSGGADAKTGILRKGTLPASASAEFATSREKRQEGEKDSPSLALPPIFSAPQTGTSDAASALEEETVLAAPAEEDLAAVPSEGIEISISEVDVSEQDNLTESSSGDALIELEDVSSVDSSGANGDEQANDEEASGEQEAEDVALADEEEPEAAVEQDESASDVTPAETMADPASASVETVAPEPIEELVREPPAAAQAVVVADETSIEEPAPSRKKLGFSGVLIGLVLALVGGGAALMIPAFKAIGIGAALAGLAITFISALGMRD